MPHHLTQLPLWQNPALLASVFGRHPSPRNVLMAPPWQPEQSEASTSQEESVFVPGLTTYMFCFKISQMEVNIPDTIHWVPGTVCRKWSVASDCARWRCPYLDKAVVYMDGPWNERFRDSFVHFVSSAALMRLIAEVRFKFLNFELQHVWNWTAAKEKRDSPTFAAFSVN